LLAVLQRKDSDSGPSSAAAPPSQFIPTPDSAGSVANYDQLYPTGVFKDSHNFLMSSYTVEDKTMHGLTDGFTYYMDERDKEWLDKNNEEARGEGTSALGGVTSPTTRHSPRSTRGKGKEPDSVQAVKISEDEFELVMGIFEKTTHEKTPFLHHVC
jgi:enhancer of polycomb-like protein